MTGAATRKARLEERADRRKRAGLPSAGAPPKHDLRTKLVRDELVEAIAEAGKRWWPTARTKANHARMSRAELGLWNAIRDLKELDGEDVR